MTKSTEGIKKDIIDISENYKPYADKMRKEGPFKGVDSKKIFIMAMVIGFQKGKQVPIKKKHSGGFIRAEYLSEEERALISAIAISKTKDLLVLKKEERYKSYLIAEEYANGGFPILQEMLAMHGTFGKNLEADLRKKLEKLKKIEF